MMTHLERALKMEAEAKELERQLVLKRAELRETLKAALSEPATREQAARAAKRTAPRARKRARPASDVNISKMVLDYLGGLQRHPKMAGEVRVMSARVPDILRDLGIDERADAVRSALKKHKEAGRLVNVDGRWEVAAQTKTPDPVKAGGDVPVAAAVTSGAAAP